MLRAIINFANVHFDRLAILLVVVSFVVLQFPTSVFAAGLTARKITLTSSAASASTTHKFDFTTATTANVGSIKYEYCTTASGSCVAPTGLNVASASLSAQTGVTGLTVGFTDANNIVVGRTPASVTSGTAVSNTFTTITNPSTTNTTFFVRITTYTGNDGNTGPTDTGVVAASTANQITVSASVDETLTFCVYTGANCAASGSTVALGTLSTSSTSSGTSKMDAATNSTSGYAITYTGATLTSGANTITALSGAASSTGSSQYGFNLKANTTPSVGSNVTGSGSGTAQTGYNTADSFKFLTGDTVASASGQTDSNTYTASYIANISNTTNPGTYTSTITYICTATY
ncbi:hypothetical protein H6800_02030 [Candidatus Nomurabacteria bacterium]|nr:hypothetical protein [Candidatus Nomurabacteria bacterium]